DYDNSISQIRRILKGHVSEVIQNMKQNLQQLSTQYKFEDAAWLKKKLEYVEDYQSSSLVVHPTITNVDVFSFQEDDKNAYVNCMRIVNGVVVQTKTVEIIKKIEEDREEMFLYVINELRSELDTHGVSEYTETLSGKSVNSVLPWQVKSTTAEI